MSSPNFNPMNLNNFSNFSNLSNFNNFLTVSVDENGDIWQLTPNKTWSKLGITVQREQGLLNIQNEMQDTLDNYYNKLVELNVIKPQKSTEEILQEQSQETNQAIKSILDELKYLHAEVTNLKKNNVEVMEDVRIYDKSNSENSSPSIGTKPPKSGRGSKQSPKDDQGDK